MTEDPVVSNFQLRGRQQGAKEKRKNQTEALCLYINIFCPRIPQRRDLVKLLEKHSSYCRLKNTQATCLFLIQYLIFSTLFCHMLRILSWYILKEKKNSIYVYYVYHYRCILVVVICQHLTFTFDILILRLKILLVMQRFGPSFLQHCIFILVFQIYFPLYVSPL